MYPLIDVVLTIVIPCSLSKEMIGILLAVFADTFEDCIINEKNITTISEIYFFMCTRIQNYF